MGDGLFKTGKAAVISTLNFRNAVPQLLESLDKPAILRKDSYKDVLTNPSITKVIGEPLSYVFKYTTLSIAAKMCK